MSTHAAGTTVGWPVGRIASLLVAFLLLLGASAISYRTQEDLLAAGHMVEHTRQVLFQIEHVLSLLKDTGSGLRSYVTSGNRADLAPSDAAVSALPGAIADLRALTVDSPNHQRRLDTLGPMVDQRVAWVNHLVDVGRARGEAALTAAETQRGKVIMDGIRALVVDMTAEENGLEATRSETARIRARWATYSQIGVTLVSLAIIALLFLAMLREVQRRRVAEAALQNSNASLEQRVGERTAQLDASERKYRSVVDHVQEAIWMHRDGVITFANPAAAKLLGADSPDRLVGRTVFSLVHPDDRQFALDRTRATIEESRPTPLVDMRFVGLDGKTRIAAACARSLGQEGKVLVSARDVTDVRQAEAQLHDARLAQSLEAERSVAARRARDLQEASNAHLMTLNASLQQAKGIAESASHELEAFSYSVAHDLRAPLRGIDGFSQALLEDYGDKLDDEGKQHLRFVRESAQQMAQLIDDLLTLSRVTRSELRREPVDLSGLVRAALARAQKNHPDRCVETIVADGLTAEGEVRLLKAALDNLLGNAWKFTSRRAQARIEVGAAVKDGERVFFVRDNGVGFDMAHAAKLFGVFQRLHSSMEFEGTGVGLATVQRIIQRHGGRIWAESQPDQGATFYFTLGNQATTEKTDDGGQGHPAGRGQSDRRGADAAGPQEEQHPP